MRMRTGTAALVLAACFLAGQPLQAAGASPDAELKADIDDALQRLESGTKGLLKWQGADRLAIRRDGDAAVAEIGNARIAIDADAAKPSRLMLDRIEIRRTAAPENGVAYAVRLPRTWVLREADGTETTLALSDDATLRFVLDARSGQARDTALALAEARLENRTGDRLATGPVSFSSRLTPDGSGGTGGTGWVGPIVFSMREVDFSFEQTGIAGTIGRIAYKAHAAGPDLAALNRLRERLEALQRNEDIPPADRLSEMLNLMPQLYSQFSVAEGELTVEKAAVREPKGGKLLSFDGMSLGGALNGLSGDTASWRIMVKEDGLDLAPGLLDPAQAARVPRRAVLDFGIENVATGPLRTIIAAGVKLRMGAGGGGAQQGMPQILAAAAMLKPVLRVYELDVETRDVAISGSAEATGSPLAPTDYAAKGEVGVRGFDGLAKVLNGVPLADYLPLLKEIGESGAGGASRLTFRIASAPAKLLTINGNDVSPWFAASTGLLRPADPPAAGAEVRAVQRALAAAGVEAPQTGRYDPATAVAVARFQKKNGLDVNGVVDPATRRKLGVAAEPASPSEPRGGRQRRPN